MKTVICGLWHVHAEEYYRVAAAHTEVLGVFEPDEQRREAFCRKYGVPVLETFEDLLQSGADAAIVCTATDQHVKVMPRLAAAGMDIFSEKVLALSTADCETIEAAVKENGVKFVISLPKKYNAEIITAKKIADSGVLGKINHFRYRNAHTGSSDCWLPPHFYRAAECGGGAMIDLGAHGMYLCDWFCGMPADAKSTFTLACSLDREKTGNCEGLEDNAITVMRYEDGCIGINETGFVSFGCPAILEVGGEQGFLMVNGQTVTLRTRQDNVTREIPLAPAQPLPIEQFCTGRVLDGCGMTEAKHLTALMEMAYQNA